MASFVLEVVVADDDAVESSPYSMSFDDDEGFLIFLARHFSAERSFGTAVCLASDGSARGARRRSFAKE
jgi:hypothetical protein